MQTTTSLMLAATASMGIATVGGTANAAILASYNFNTDLTSSDADLDSIASVVADGGGFGTLSDSGGFDGETTPTLVFGTFAVLGEDQQSPNENIAGAFSDGDFLEFTVTAETGLVLNLSNLTFEVTNHNASFGDVFNYAVRSSVDSFTTDLFTLSDTRDNAIALSPDVDLSDVGFQGLESVTFRIAIFNSGDGNTDFRGLGVDNVTLNGEVVVPEPATLMLATVGGLLCLARTRRPG